MAKKNPPKKEKAQAADSSNLLAAFAYIVTIVSLALVILEKKDLFIRKHALQALCMDVLFFISWIALYFLVLVSILTIIGPFIMIPVMFVYGLCFALFRFYCAWRAFNKQEFEIPIVSGFVKSYV